MIYSSWCYMMDYDLKANVTTILTFLIIPVLAGLGVDSVTGTAVVGVIATLVCYLAMYLNERYLSGIFTKEGYSVQKDGSCAECSCEEDAVNPEYESPFDEGVQ